MNIATAFGFFMLVANGVFGVVMLALMECGVIPRRAPPAWMLPHLLASFLLVMLGGWLG